MGDKDPQNGYDVFNQKMININKIAYLMSLNPVFFIYLRPGREQRAQGYQGYCKLMPSILLQPLRTILPC
jgi:hypothetical protein